MIRRNGWLSITPEPERELPWAVATLRRGAAPEPDAVAAEQVKIERVILRGSRRSWLRYLAAVVELIERRAYTDDPDVERARERAVAVVSNHHSLLLALPGPGSARAAADRERLASDSRQARGRP